MSKLEERKVRKVGNSLTITIPKSIVNENQLREGDTVEIESYDGEIRIKKREGIVTQEFMKLVEEIANENDDILKGLVER